MGWFGDGVVGEEEGVGGVKVHLFVWCSCFGLVVTAHSRYEANDNRTRSDTSSDSLIRFDLRSRRVMHGGGGMRPMQVHVIVGAWVPSYNRRVSIKTYVMVPVHTKLKLQNSIRFD